MAYPDYKFAGGKPDDPATTDAMRRSARSEAPPPRSVAGRGRVSNFPVSFAAPSDGLPKLVDQSVPMNQHDEDSATSCPSEVFLG